ADVAVSVRVKGVHAVAVRSVAPECERCVGERDLPCGRRTRWGRGFRCYGRGVWREIGPAGDSWALRGTGGETQNGDRGPDWLHGHFQSRVCEARPSDSICRLTTYVDYLTIRQEWTRIGCVKKKGRSRRTCGPSGPAQAMIRC